MSTNNNLSEYQVLNRSLVQSEIGLTAAEIHGLISGILCGGNRDESWQTLLYDLTNEGMAYPHALLQQIHALYTATRDALESEEFLFDLLLPRDDSAVFERADALSGWVNHFLLGLGMAQPKLAKETGETGEAIEDLRNIANLGYDEDEDAQQLEVALEEVSEYVRVAVMLCHTEFSARQPTVATQDKPTLH